MKGTVELFGKAVFLLLAACMLAPAADATAQQRRRNPLRERDAAFFATDEARRIGDQVLLFQRCTGGWPKNIDMARRMSDRELQLVAEAKSRRDDSTIDNGATTLQMVFLARLYRETHDVRYRDAFRRGVEYLLNGQYENGGWPQFWPEMRSYQPHITFNDDAIVNTLELLRDIAQAEAPYDGDLTDEALRVRMTKAFDKGIDCILKCQIVVKGEPAVWCQQHDRETLAPAPARAFELASYCSQESAAIVRLLMSLPDPDARVKRAVHGAMKWFDTYKLTGLRYERRFGADGRISSQLTEDPTGKPLWARFYDLERCEPFVCDRDGLPRRRLEQIGAERRNGYAWYGTRPADLYPQYEAWAAKYDPKHRVRISLETKGANENGTIELYRKPAVDRKAFDAVVKPGQSIRAAIERAPKAGSAPYRILLTEGTYRERIVIDRPNIVLVGENRATTILQVTDEMIEGGRDQGVVIRIEQGADDCVISGLTIRNDYDAAKTPVPQRHWLPHRMAILGSATRTILINCDIRSEGNDVLSLWAPGGEGMYYHADLNIECPGVDFICPRGWCYATRCRFYGDGRAMIWHDGRGDRNKKFVITNSTFDAASPTLLGRYHHDSQFYLIDCALSKNILDGNIHYAYSDQVLDPCAWGQRTYYYRCTREGGHSGWLQDNLREAEGAPAFYGITARWTFDGKWDPEQRIRELWNVLAY